MSEKKLTIGTEGNKKPIEAEGNDQYADWPLMPGELLIIPLDNDGKEKGKPFTVTQRTFDKLYSDDKRYKVKKKA